MKVALAADSFVAVHPRIFNGGPYALHVFLQVNRSVIKRRAVAASAKRTFILSRNNWAASALAGLRIRSNQYRMFYCSHESRTNLLGLGSCNKL